jgi:hypothetical protein
VTYKLHHVEAISCCLVTESHAAPAGLQCMHMSWCCFKAALYTCRVTRMPSTCSILACLAFPAEPAA